MSKLSELAIVKEELLHCSEELWTLSEKICQLAHTWDEAETDTAPKPDTKPITLEQVRAVLAEKSVQGHTTKVQALIHKHGVEKLSQVDPVHYADLLAEAEAL